MRCVLLGPPGAGKGSLAVLLREMTGVAHVSTGDMLREEMQRRSEIGLEIEESMQKGSLISDEIVTKLVEYKVATDPDLAKGYMLDGFPRTVHQAKHLDQLLVKINHPLDFVLYMDANTDLILLRLTGRRVCRKCGALFNLKNRPPKILNVCDICQGELYQRSDDNEETIRRRIRIYESRTKPIVKYYAAQDKLISISGEKETIDVRNDLIKMLNENKSN